MQKEQRIFLKHQANKEDDKHFFVYRVINFIAILPGVYLDHDSVVGLQNTFPELNIEIDLPQASRVV